MVSGQQPFQGANLLALAESIRSSEPSLLTEGASSVNATVRRALSKEASARYQAVSDLLGDLRNSTRFTTPTTFQPDVPSIAVLPFADMSAGRDQEFFSDGLAEEIINTLTHVEGLKVIARTSAFAFKG